MGMIVIAVLLGIFRTFIHVPVSLIYAGHLPTERFLMLIHSHSNSEEVNNSIAFYFYRRFAAGYGLFMFLQGNLMFILGPIVGWIRDTTQSYVILIHCLQFFMSLCVIPWLIEIVWLRVYPRKTDPR